MDAPLLYAIAESRDDIEGAAHLAYDNYVRQGYCRDNAHRLYLYLFDALPETRVLVALQDGRVQATLTLVFDGALGLPSEKLYGEELGALRKNGRRMAEISRLSVHPAMGSRGMRALRGLFRLAWLLAGPIRGATDFVVLVEPHHETFYTRALRFDRIGDLKPDPDASNAPSVLLRLDLTGAPALYRQAFGDRESETNMHWYCCRAPDIAGIEADARETDRRLNALHARLTEGEPFVPETARDLQYMEYWLFMLQFNLDVVSRDADMLARNAMFGKAIGMYEKLLRALPLHYAPERRSEIFLNISLCAWNCALYEKAVQLAQTARALRTAPDVAARAWAAEAVALHFLERHGEADACLREGLTVANASPTARALLLRYRGRMELDRGRQAEGRALLVRAWRALGRTVRSDAAPWTTRFRVNLAFDLFVADYSRGHVRTARKRLDTTMALAKTEGLRTESMFLQGYARAALLACRFEEAREQATRALTALQDESSAPHSAAVLRVLRGDAWLNSGHLAEARRDAEKGLALACQTKKGGMLVEAARLTSDIMAFEGRDAEARAVFERFAGKTPLSPRVARAVAFRKAEFALDDGDRSAAHRHLDDAEPDPDEDPLGHALIRLLRVRCAALSGCPDEAMEVWTQSPAPDQFPGCADYAVQRALAEAVCHAAAARDEAAARSFRNAMRKYGNVAAQGAATRAAMQMAHVLVWRQAKVACPRLWRVIRTVANESDALSRFPNLRASLERLRLTEPV